MGGSKPDELDEVDSGRPVSHQSLQSGDLGQSRRGRQMSITLDKFTGDSLLHFSYSAVGGGAGGMLSESSLGKQFVIEQLWHKNICCFSVILRGIAVLM